MPCFAAAAMARSSQSKSYSPSLGSMRLQANSPTRTMWMPACCMSVRSASQRDSGHCSGYHAVPSSMGGGGGAWFCAIAGASENRTAASNKEQKWNEVRDMIFLGRLLAAELSQLPGRKLLTSGSGKMLVPKKGLEPPHPCGYMDLNHARLPIPPLRRVTNQDSPIRLC